MRNRNLLSLALTAGTAAALLGAPAAHAVRIPRIPGGLPRAPKVTQYDATLDVAGYIEVKSELDDTKECMPGRDLTIEFDSSFETHGGRATRITVVNGALVSKPVSNPGGVSHKGVLAAYRETNYCPPARRVEQEKPRCVRSNGRFSAILGSDASRYTAGSDDPAPLAYPVNVALWRRGGIAQDPTCRRHLSGLHFQRPGDYELSTFDQPITGIVIPLFANDWDFVGLKKGRWLRRTITLGGACDKVLASKGALGSAAKYLSKCTVRGRIYVAIRRTS